MFNSATATNVFGAAITPYESNDDASDATNAANPAADDTTNHSTNHSTDAHCSAAAHCSKCATNHPK